MNFKLIKILFFFWKLTIKCFFLQNKLYIKCLNRFLFEIYLSFNTRLSENCTVRLDYDFFSRKISVFYRYFFKLSFFTTLIIEIYAFICIEAWIWSFLNNYSLIFFDFKSFTFFQWPICILFQRPSRKEIWW